MHEPSHYEIFELGLANYAASAPRKIANSTVCAFLPLRGCDYSGELMVVGRATNGWLDEQHNAAGTGCATALSLRSDTKRRSFSEVIRRDATTRDPMSWVLKEWNGKDYQARRSAFWRVARNAFRSLGKAHEQAENWSSHLVWSNLYKVAPKRGGDPGTLMRNAQEDWCVEMLAKELEAYKPQNILFMTGYAGWAEPFLERLGFTPSAAKPRGFLEASGQLTISITQTCRVAVVPHPQGKPEWEIVTQAVSAFTR